MSINSYFCVKKETENEMIIERSRFISYVKPCRTEEEARAFIEEKRKAHPFATHNCYAYIVNNGEISRFSDDGEPQGTAGLPMLEAIKGKGLCNTTVVVTRYFGGIKLGAGGLVRAYGGAASDVLALSEKEEHVPSVLFSLTLPYDRYSAFLSRKESFRHKILSSDFGETILITLAVPEEESFRFYSDMNDLFAGKVPISRLNEDFAVY